MNMEAVALTCILLYATYFGSCLIWRRCSGVTLLSPLVVFFGSIVVRTCGGIWLQLMQPMNRVITGEYGQYIIARKYISEVSWMWFVFVLGVLTTVCIASSQIKKSASHVLSDECSGKLLIVNDRQTLESQEKKKALVDLVTIFLTFFFLEGIVGFATGATDRGASYTYWSQQAFKPISLFVGLSRIKQLSYFMVPFCVINSKTQLKRLLIVILTVFSIAPSIATGSRGDLLYPVVMMILGAMVVTRARKRVIIAGLLSIALLAPAVPYIAAYRDNPGLGKTPVHDIRGRISLLVNGVSKERFEYRMSALGREVYACSDAFIFKPVNKDKRAGFRDLDLDVVVNTLKPRVFDTKKSFEKLDGSSIAQRLMNTQVAGWFPCLSTPADLWRRGGAFAVYVGGILMGVLLVVCEMAWLWHVKSSYRIFSVLCVVYPVTYYQNPFGGTVREVFWLASWDLIKYIAVLLVVSLIVEKWVRLNERVH